METYWGSGGV